ncbi:cysteine proteinase [Sistotremastrum niveocremeum HHB9708]|uniref:Cysteine proteinase n=2 Tax=Sistotremastraceae TaxID=3402574 RepID=A0A165AML4_9AGAM|nr:cysteine proteinase [Sistotremastrum niveocremeum HHB9708]KZT42116.1 cysteine proteinase [Sistotremastrum suecicum HHB10207 ss-3]
MHEYQARKAAALASTYQQTDADADARLEAEIKHEETTIKRICDELGVEMYEINPDGHCLFSAVADQLMILGELLTASYVQTRTAAADYMLSHPDDFLPFLPSLDGEDGAGATDTGLMNLAQFTQYCSNVRTTAIWGGEPEILALSRAFNIPIHVVQTGNPPIVVHEPGVNTGKGGVGGKAVRISYHRRMYGLGEHYNSLRPKGLIKQIPGAIKAALS